MVFLRKSSYSMSLRTGTIMAAMVNLFLHVVVAVGAPVLVHTVVKQIKDQIDSSGVDMIKNLFKPLIQMVVDFCYALLGVCGVMAVASLVLLFGAVLETKRCLVPFLLLQPVLYLLIIHGLYKTSTFQMDMPAMPSLPITTPDPAAAGAGAGAGAAAGAGAGGGAADPAAAGGGAADPAAAAAGGAAGGPDPALPDPAVPAPARAAPALRAAAVGGASDTKILKRAADFNTRIQDQVVAASGSAGGGMNVGLAEDQGEGVKVTSSGAGGGADAAAASGAAAVAASAGGGTNVGGHHAPAKRADGLAEDQGEGEKVTSSGAGGAADVATAPGVAAVAASAGGGTNIGGHHAPAKRADGLAEDQGEGEKVTSSGAGGAADVATAPGVAAVAASAGGGTNVGGHHAPAKRADGPAEDQGEGGKVTTPEAAAVATSAGGGMNVGGHHTPAKRAEDQGEGGKETAFGAGGGADAATAPVAAAVAASEGGGTNVGGHHAPAKRADGLAEDQGEGGKVTSSGAGSGADAAAAPGAAAVAASAGGGTNVSGHHAPAKRAEDQGEDGKETAFGAGGGADAMFIAGAMSGLGDGMKTIKIIIGCAAIFLGLVIGYCTLVVASYYVELWKEERYQTRIYVLRHLKTFQ